MNKKILYSKYAYLNVLPELIDPAVIVSFCLIEFLITV